MRLTFLKWQCWAGAEQRGGEKNRKSCTKESVIIEELRTYVTVTVLKPINHIWSAFRNTFNRSHKLKLILWWSVAAEAQLGKKCMLLVDKVKVGSTQLLLMVAFNFDAIFALIRCFLVTNDHSRLPFCVIIETNKYIFSNTSHYSQAAHAGLYLELVHEQHQKYGR